jgi:hypothetical protein
VHCHRNSDGARKRVAEAIREADRAEAEAWSIQMEGYGGPAQPSPTIANVSLFAALILLLHQNDHAPKAVIRKTFGRWTRGL